MTSSRPEAKTDAPLENNFNEADILRQEVELQELLVHQLRQRKAVRDEMLRRLRTAMHTSEAFDFEELTNDANELLHEIEEGHKHNKEKIQEPPVASTPKIADAAVVDVTPTEGAANGVTMDELMGVEEDGHKKKKRRRKRNKKKTGNQHVDPTAAINEEGQQGYVTIEEKKDAEHRAALFAALEEVHFDDRQKTVPPLSEEGPAWLQEEEALPAAADDAEEEYSDDFEDYNEQEEAEAEAAKEEQSQSAEEEVSDDEEKNEDEPALSEKVPM